MLLTELSITNYKSFFETKSMEFGRGFNVLLGANSSGKTTVLEAIQFRDVQNIPHRSIANILEPDTPWINSTSVSTKFELPTTQLQKLVSSDGLTVMLSDENGGLLGGDISAIDEFWKTHDFSIRFHQIPGSDPDADFFPCGRQSRKRGRRLDGVAWRATIKQNGIEFPTQAYNVIGGDDKSDLTALALHISNRIYRFSAERVVRVMCQASTPELMPDASNLAFCINYLRSSDDVVYELLNEYLHRIFPNIHGLSSIPRQDGYFELRVHTIPKSTGRPDLSVPMDRVGTGVCNAIAMLYVALTARTSRIILLEEPNSYLHPRALRELLAILAEAGTKHQFFITTHSSEVLRCVQASTVTLLENDGVQTLVRQTLQGDLKSFQGGLLDLGIRLTDLHGCDRVLWVEGETEEAIFPLLLSKFFPDVAQGIAVLKLHATGDFESRKYRAGKVAEIYRRLSTATFLAPPMIAITLDREGKQQNQIESLSEESKGIIYFLPRPMIEDYLLVPEAITKVLLTEFDAKVQLSDVASSLDRAFMEMTNRLAPKNPNDTTVHAAKVLQQVFVELGGAGASYDKATHGPLLARQILSESPTEFSELKQWFGTFITKPVI